MSTIRRRAAAPLLAFSLALTVGAAASAQQPPPGAHGVSAGAAAPVDTAAVDAVFGPWAGTASPGCAVGVSRAGATVLSRAYGMADLEHGVPNSSATVFEAGSVSKQFTAAAIVLLAQEGRLALDDDVRTYVPELPDHGATITIRHLLNHTSGLRDWGSVAEIAGWGRGDRTHSHDHVLDILSRQRELNYPPGAAYSYTNSGYNLAAIIVERVTGESFADFSRRRIFEPLGLRSTQWRDDYRRIVKGRASAYARRGEGYVIDRPIEHVHGNGGLLTTVADLLTWNDALADGRIGGEWFVREMHRRGVLGDGTAIDYASGITIGSYRGVPEVSHTGATSGYRAVLLRFPDERLGVAVLCNAGDVNPGAIGRRVADLFLGGAPDPAAGQQPAAEGAPTTAAPAYSAAQLAEYAGEYYSPDADATLLVTVAEGGLVAGRRPSERLPLEPMAPDAFRSPFGAVVFLRNGAGRVDQVGVRVARVWDLRFDRRERDGDVTIAPIQSSQ